MNANGTFDVKISPLPLSYDGGEVQCGRFSLAKQFHGDLDASSTVEMLGARTPIADSAGYVAIERVTGSLHGKSGSFVLQHSGTMTRGKGELHVSVVPDSGTGELRGLSGRMTIEISDGNHSYRFDHSFEDAPAARRLVSPRWSRWEVGL